MMNLFGSKNSWKEQLLSLEGYVRACPSASDWVGSTTVADVLLDIAGHLDQDLKTLKKEAGFLFSTQADIEKLTEQNVELLRRWQFLGDSPSIVALCIYALEQFEPKVLQKLINAVLIAGVLAEVRNDHAYHNNMHFKKVLLQTIRLIAVHNEIYKATAHALEDEQICLLLIAACIHDLGHDGQGNTVKGVFEQSRLEKRAFALAEPYFKAIGFDDVLKLDAIRIMLLCTDVSPLDDPTNPMSQMKAAYRWHFLGEKAGTQALNLDDDLSRLEIDEVLALMALILHEADMATSAGLDYSVTKYETTLHRRELGLDDAAPEHITYFIKQICQKRMISDAGQKLYAANLARIFALAEEDEKNGNHPFPDLEHSDLMLAAQGADSGSKTIN